MAVEQNGPSPQATVVHEAIAKARQRSYEDGRRGCCYKSGSYLESTMRPQASEQDMLKYERENESEAPESPLQRLALLNADRVTLRSSSALKQNPGAKYCKFDAVRAKLTETRKRNQGIPQTDYLDSTTQAKGNVPARWRRSTTDRDS
eukprot:CAMPEP_0119299044 /NCGR_PEP_ID=MMETSP1333-20130426/1160_1 /TAXON_ID=418940 /ORGANISM="Scyphosphaera apsteinii, Strain RCC1455" /LENGTH=147 /DNA_ID=CAMNT_0007300331 /DNA_START=117 /DNA_END=560 /DNA_ORIENTATION=-